MALLSRCSLKISFFSYSVQLLRQIFSIRSSRGLEMALSQLAEQMKRTLERSIAWSMQLSTNDPFWLGSRIQSSQDRGSPWAPLPILSISSSRMTGLLVSQCFSAQMILPAQAATQVLLCPFSTDESVTPPREMLQNFLPRALAMDLAMVVLPRPGPPMKQKILPFRVPFSLPTAMISRIESLTSFMPQCSASRAFSADSRSNISSDLMEQGIWERSSRYFLMTPDQTAVSSICMNFSFSCQNTSLISLGGLILLKSLVTFSMKTSLPFLPSIFCLAIFKISLQYSQNFLFLRFISAAFSMSRQTCFQSKVLFIRSWISSIFYQWSFFSRICWISLGLKFSLESCWAMRQMFLLAQLGLKSRNLYLLQLGKNFLQVQTRYFIFIQRRWLSTSGASSIFQTYSEYRFRFILRRVVEDSASSLPSPPSSSTSSMLLSAQGAFSALASTSYLTSWILLTLTRYSPISSVQLGWYLILQQVLTPQNLFSSLLPSSLAISPASSMTLLTSTTTQLGMSLRYSFICAIFQPKLQELKGKMCFQRAMPYTLLQKSLVSLMTEGTNQDLGSEEKQERRREASGLGKAGKWFARRNILYLQF